MRVALRFNVRVLEEVGRHRDGVGLHSGLELQMHRPMGDFVFLWIERPALHTLREAVPVAERLQAKWRELVDDHFDIYFDPCGGYNFVSIASHVVQVELAVATSEAWRRAAIGHEDDFFQSARHPMAGSHGL